MTDYEIEFNKLRKLLFNTEEYYVYSVKESVHVSIRDDINAIVGSNNLPDLLRGLSELFDDSDMYRISRHDLVDLLLAYTTYLLQLNNEV